MSYSSLIRERKEKASAIAREAHGGEVVQLDLGKKVSVPQDVMMEELSLLSNKGSKMFQMRQKRVDKFTVEGVGGSVAGSDLKGGVNTGEYPGQHHMGIGQNVEGMKENYRTEVHIMQPGKGSGPAVAPKPYAKLSAAKNIKVVLNPNIIAPGYSGPLKEIPPEKFNITAIPRSYQSPWAEALGEQTDLLETVVNQLPEAPPKVESQTYRCFNRVATPFGGPGACRRLLEVQGYEFTEIPEEPVVVDTPRFTNRPSFNRLARGWTGPPLPESPEL
ncbi:myozenin-2-like [Pristis pectinata]|uniref:myozenin-2-like n=1 Tax=Pristis pectinata TaxID=685728 RepID=UPI00223CA458|nr:myozenin-2-like [Pristis pectinata]